MANEAKRMCPPDTADYDTARRRRKGRPETYGITSNPTSDEKRR